MLFTMKQTLILILAISFALTTGTIATSGQKSEKKASGKTVTGCLQKGDEADEFSLTGDDGQIYGLRSSAVKLSDHVGHKVTVAGTFKAEGYEKDEARESKESSKKEAGDIQVKSLKMVSSSCQ